MTVDFSLNGGVALVTGAGSGIGRAIALGLADAGALLEPGVLDGSLPDTCRPWAISHGPPVLVLTRWPGNVGPVSDAASVLVCAVVVTVIGTVTL